MFSLSVLSECSLTHTTCVLMVLSLTHKFLPTHLTHQLTHRVFSLILSHYLFSHTNSSPTLLTHTCYPWYSLTECSHSYSHTTCSLTPTHSYSRRVFSLILTHVLPITVIPVVLTLTSFVFSQSVLTHSHTQCSLWVFSLTLSHSVLSECSHRVFSHQLFSLTHVIPDTLSQSVIPHTLTPTHSHQLTHTLTLLVLHTHVIPDTLSQSVLTLHSHPHTHTIPITTYHPLPTTPP